MKSGITSKRLVGRVALVTGGSKGLGRAITLRLVREGAIVVVCGRDPKGFASIKSAVNGKSMTRKLDCVVADVTKPEDIERLIEHIRSRHGHLDILVNNVGGVKQFGIFHEMSDKDWREVFEDNLMTTVRVTRMALPLLAHSANPSVINIASVAGVQAGFFNCHYGSMKAAQIHLTKYLAANYGKQGIRFNAVAPSTIQGGVWERDVKSKADKDDTSYQVAQDALTAEVAAKSVLGSVGTSEDVAATVAYLASDDANMITGSCINVDGGTVRAI